MTNNIDKAFVKRICNLIDKRDTSFYSNLYQILKNYKYSDTERGIVFVYKAPQGKILSINYMLKSESEGIVIKRSAHSVLQYSNIMHAIERIFDQGQGTRLDWLCGDTLRRLQAQNHIDNQRILKRPFVRINKEHAHKLEDILNNGAELIHDGFYTYLKLPEAAECST